MGKKFLGRHKFVCDVDGMTYYSEDKRVRWDGAIVHKDNWEPRHPQDLIKSVKEDTSIKDARPEVGHGSDQAAGYDFLLEAEYPTFGWVDENGVLMADENDVVFQIPPTNAVLS